MTFCKMKAAIDTPQSTPPYCVCVCVCVLLHLQHLLQVFPALSSQGWEVCFFLTQRLLGGGQLGPHWLQLLLHLLHGPQQLLHLGTHTHTHTNNNLIMIRVKQIPKIHQWMHGAFYHDLPIWRALIRGGGSRIHVRFLGSTLRQL